MSDINIKRVVPVDNDQHRPEEHTEPVKLENRAFNPFQDWSDWYAENGEAVITFITMKQHLYEEWQRQAMHINISEDLALKNNRPVKDSDSVVLYQHRRFENDFDGPGIYQDDTHYEDSDKVDESYTIIVPEEFMTREMCEEYLYKLNEEYNREFYFQDQDFQQKRVEFTAAELQSSDEIDTDDISDEKLEKLVKKTLDNRV